MTIDRDIAEWGAREHNRIVLALHPRLEAALNDPEPGRVIHDTLTDALTMLGVEPDVASMLIGEYFVAQGPEKAQAFVSGLQLGLLLARREAAESA